MLKLMRQYLHWIQNSVFEGELTKGQFSQLVISAQKIMDKKEDSLIFFEMDSNKYIQKKVYGIDKDDFTSNLI